MTVLKGFAAMDPDKQRELARKGGLTVSDDREHMSAMGRKGGLKIAADRQHMAEIGRKGGAAGKKKKKEVETGG
jgi:hypothetical protein